jgi:3-carboxy-cis,cis-muconate cycloisomerase
MAEAVMMALAPIVGHERAHHLLLVASRQAAAEDRDLAEVLREHPEVAAHLTEVELRRLMDPASYLGLSAASAVAVAGRVEEAAP